MKRKTNKPPKHIIEQYTDGLRQAVLDSGLPSEVLLGNTLMTMIGPSELWIENYKTLLEYQEQKIVVQTKKNIIQIEGQKLCICHYMEEHMMICGNIRSITYL